MSTNLLALVLSVFLGTPTIAASIAYEPLFPLDSTLASSPRGTVMGDYAIAQSSENPKVAMARWGKFLDDHTYGEPVEFDDLTHLYFVRQAHYELMRLYYIHGRTDEADSLLRQVQGLTVYSPRPIGGDPTRWCKTNGYCR